MCNACGQNCVDDDFICYKYISSTGKCTMSPLVICDFKGLGGFQCPAYSSRHMAMVEAKINKQHRGE